MSTFKNFDKPFLYYFIACLADEELQAEEESIEELRRKAEEERFRAQLEAQQREEERRKEEERRYYIFEIFSRKRLKLLNAMGVAGLFFEPHPPNLMRFHFSLTYKSAEIFVRLP